MITLFTAWLRRYPLPALLGSFIVLLAGPAIVCPFAPSGSDLAGKNAYYNAPTPSPIPPPTPIPTVCATEVPGPDGTPGPQRCSAPIPTWTPLPSPTPYGRWLSPGDRGTGGTFYLDQDVRIGTLRITLQSYRSVAIPNLAGQAAHAFTFRVANEGGQDLHIQWPLQMTVREIAGGDGQTTAGGWWETSRAEAAAGVPAWNPDRGTLAPGQQQTLTLAVQGPSGSAHAIGFLPDPVGGQMRPGVGQAPHIIWFVPQNDPNAEGNTSGPARPGDGGATYGKPLPPPRPAIFGYFGGWPVLANGSSVISQGFGCTDFREISGFDCPNDRPWYHSGVDIANPARPLLYSIVRGRVTFIGPSPGRACSFPGAEVPNTNLGWMIQIQAVDETGHVGPYTVKYGHTKVGSQRVQVGDLVQPGDPLAQMASTGCSTGSHVHLMIQNEAGTFLDPMSFIGADRR